MADFEMWIYDKDGNRYGPVNCNLKMSDMQLKRLNKPQYDGMGLMIITDERDIAEMARRKKLKLFQPPIDELYTINPDFDGNYSH